MPVQVAAKVRQGVDGDDGAIDDDSDDVSDSDVGASGIETTDDKGASRHSSSSLVTQAALAVWSLNTSTAE